MKIMSIGTTHKNDFIPNVYTVGETFDEAGFAMFAGLTIEKITYHRAAALYNKGFQTDEAGYSVAFVDSNIRHLIPEREVVLVGVDITKEKKEKKEHIPDLPGGNNDTDDEAPDADQS